MILACTVRLCRTSTFIALQHCRGHLSFQLEARSLLGQLFHDPLPLYQVRDSVSQFAIAINILWVDKSVHCSPKANRTLSDSAASPQTPTVLAVIPRA
jgi:hypothetical protein